MGFTDAVLRKHWLRSDALWARPLVYRSKLLRTIPFFLDTRALLRSQYWNRVTIAHYQTERIAQVLTEARDLPFWKSAFDGAGITAPYDLTALEKLPIISKSSFAAVPENEYVRANLVSTSQKDQTSGSTGRPFSFYHNLGYFLRSFGVSERIQRISSNGKRSPLIMIRRGNRPGFAFRNFDFFYLESYTSLKHRIDALLDLMRRRGKPVLFLWGSVAVELARLVEERGIQIDVAGLLVTGEAIRLEDRAYIEKILGARVTVYYAGSEMGRLAFECERQRLHVNEEWAYMEIIDDAGQAVVPGAHGRIVVTLFDNDVMPLIRYDSGDRGALSDVRCPCGRGLRTLELDGRQIHILKFPDGRTASVLDIKARFDRLSGTVDQYQIVRDADYDFTMRVIPGNNFESKREEVSDTLVRLIHPSARIRWEITDAIEPLASGKAAYFIDHTTRS